MGGGPSSWRRSSRSVPVEAVALPLKKDSLASSSTVAASDGPLAQHAVAGAQGAQSSCANSAGIAQATDKSPTTSTSGAVDAADAAAMADDVASDLVHPFGADESEVRSQSIASVSGAPPISASSTADLVYPCASTQAVFGDEPFSESAGSWSIESVAVRSPGRTGSAAAARETESLPAATENAVCVQSMAASADTPGQLIAPCDVAQSGVEMTVQLLKAVEDEDWTSAEAVLQAAKASRDAGAVGVDVDPNALTPTWGYTLLRAAAEDGAIEVCGLLLELRASVNIADSNGMTPLMSAVIGGDRPDLATSLLAAGADVTAKTGDGFSALAWATRLKHDECALVLRSAGAEGKDTPF